MSSELIERLSLTAVLLIAGGFMIAVLSWAAAPAGATRRGARTTNTGRSVIVIRAFAIVSGNGRGTKSDGQGEGGPRECPC
jgi:hypothetical protein